MRAQTQITGRMGELVVELELLKRGWWATNFNSATTNFVGWDIFAANGEKSIKIRVKAKKSGETAFRWSANTDGTILKNLSKDDKTDFVFAVSFKDNNENYDIYVIPSNVVEATVKKDHKEYLTGKNKHTGGDRKDSNMRIINMDDKDSVGRGYINKWKKYRLDEKTGNTLEKLLSFES